MDPLPPSYFEEQIENADTASSRGHIKPTKSDIKLQRNFDEHIGELYIGKMVALGYNCPSLEEATAIYNCSRKSRF